MAKICAAKRTIFLNLKVIEVFRRAIKQQKELGNSQI